jgi:hypothetical protein
LLTSLYSAILRAGERKKLLRKVFSFPPVPLIFFQTFLCSLFLSEHNSKRKSGTKVLNNMGSMGKSKDIVLAETGRLKQSTAQRAMLILWTLPSILLA